MNAKRTALPLALRLGGRLILACFWCLLGCGGDGGSDGDAGGQAGNRVTYSGTATVETWEQGGAVRTVTTNVRVIVGPALVVRQQAETNPINLEIYSTVAENAAGHFWMRSASEVQPDLGPTPILLQYWTYQYDGVTVSGSLTDRHTDEAAATNMINCFAHVGLEDGFWPFSMLQGSTIQGTLNANGADLVIQGTAGWWVQEQGFRITIRF